MSAPQFTVTVLTQYLPDRSSATDDVYAFAYTVNVRNTGDVTAQLVARHWVITDAAGDVEEVRGAQARRAVRIHQLDAHRHAARAHAWHLLLHDGGCALVRGPGTGF
jgi:uncharacterized protein affecting Mg2+/Co2+ transport